MSETTTANTAGAAGAAHFYDGDYVMYPGGAPTDVGAYGASGWVENAAPDSSINPQGKLEFEFTGPGNAAFFRLEAE